MLLRALARRPADRWKDAVELAAQLAWVRRAPGVTRRPAAAPAVAADAAEMTQAVPASPAYQEDPTTALSVPALRALRITSRPPAVDAAVPLVRTREVLQTPVVPVAPATTVAPVGLGAPPEDGPSLLARAEPTVDSLPTRRSPAPRASSPLAQPRPAEGPPDATEALPALSGARTHRPASLQADEHDDGATMVLSASPRSHAPLDERTEVLRADHHFNPPARAARMNLSGLGEPATTAAATEARRTRSPALPTTAPSSAPDDVLDRAAVPAERSRRPAPYVLIGLNVALGLLIIVLIALSAF